MSEPVGETTLHVEVHRDGHLVVDADVSEDPRTGVRGELHNVTSTTRSGPGACLVDEIDHATTSAPGSTVVFDLPAEAGEMLDRVQEVYDDVVSRHAGDRVIATGAVAEEP